MSLEKYLDFYDEKELVVSFFRNKWINKYKWERVNICKMVNKGLLDYVLVKKRMLTRKMWMWTEKKKVNKCVWDEMLEDYYRFNLEKKIWIEVIHLGIVVKTAMTCRVDMRFLRSFVMKRMDEFCLTKKKWWMQTWLLEHWEWGWNYASWMVWRVLWVRRTECRNYESKH